MISKFITEKGRVYLCDTCKTTTEDFKSHKAAKAAGWAISRGYKKCFCPTCAPLHRNTGCLGAPVVQSPCICFSSRLKELREEKSLSQAQLAKELGVAVSSVGMWESTKRIPPAQRLQGIAEYFGVTVDELLGTEITPAEQAAGATPTRKASITPIEDELLHAFRKLGKKHGEPTQQSVIDMIEKMCD